MIGTPDLFTDTHSVPDDVSFDATLEGFPGGRPSISTDSNGLWRKPVGPIQNSSHDLRQSDVYDINTGIALSNKNANNFQDKFKYCNKNVPNDSIKDSINYQKFNLHPDFDKIHGSEIIVVSGIHYNPCNLEGSNNPDWIIITCNPTLFSRTPRNYYDDNNRIVGSIVPRGQIEFINGQPILHTDAMKIPPSKMEIDSSIILPQNIINPVSIPSAPFNFDDINGDLNIEHLFQIFQEFNLLVINEIKQTQIQQNFQNNYIQNNHFTQNWQQSNSNSLNIQNNFQIQNVDRQNEEINFTVQTQSNTIENQNEHFNFFIPTQTNTIERHNEHFNYAVQTQSNSLEHQNEHFNYAVQTQSNSLEHQNKHFNFAVQTQSNSINHQNEHFNIVVPTQSNSIIHNNEHFKYAVHTQSNSIDHRNKHFKYAVQTQSNSIEHCNQHYNIPISTQSNSIQHFNKHFDFKVYTQSNTLHQHNDYVEYQVNTQSNVLNFHENIISKTVEIPKIQLDIVEKPVNIKLNVADLLSSFTSKDSDDSLSSSGRNVSDSDNINSNSVSDDVTESSVGTQTLITLSCPDDNGSNDNNDPTSSDSENSNSDDNIEQWLVEKLSAINNKQELSDFLVEYKDMNSDFHNYDNVDVLIQPLIIRMKAQDRWLGPGQFHCSYCEEVFKTCMAVFHHTASCHNNDKTINFQASTEYIVGKTLRWSIDNADLPDEVPRYKEIYVCPLKCCNYVTANRNALSSHISASHQDLDALKNEVGLFWGMLIMHARNAKELLNAKDIFTDRKGFICRHCYDAIGLDTKSIQNHIKRVHPTTNLEGHIHEPLDIVIKANWFSNDTQTDDISTANEGYANSRDLRTRREDDNVRQVEPRNDDNINLDARENRRRYEENIHNIHSQGRIRNNEALPIPRLHLTTSSSSSDSDVAMVNPNDGRNDDDINNSDDVRDILTNRNVLEECISKADNWKNKCIAENKNFVNLPKLWGKHLLKKKNKIVSIFDSKIKPVLKWYKDACQLAKHFLFSDERNITLRLLCDGMIAKISLIIRKEIRTLTDTFINKNRAPKIRSTELPIQLRYATKFIAGINRIHELTHNVQFEDLDQTYRNLISDIKGKLLRFLERAPEQFVSLVGSIDLQSIDALIDDDNFEARSSFLRSKLEELEISQMNNSSTKYQKFIQKAYNEDAKRTLNWFILKDDTPECTVPVEEFERIYGSTWENAADLGDDEEGLFKLERTLSDESWNMFTTHLMNEDSISRTINSRSNLSASGADGICNGIWRSGGKITVEIIKHIIDCMLTTGLFPETLKLNKTSMLYKKGDPNDPHSWRPITVTPTLYRMVMCHISRSIQSLNSSHPFISMSQKGFMKIPSAAAEHASVVDEMIHDASRNKKSLYILTIDFQDAFGSVPHQLIRRNLEDIGFNKKFYRSILDSYKDSTTRILSNNRKSRECFISKGVKQGCPLSPTLFNICLEPLLRRLNMHQDDGYHWFGGSTVVQAYADDVILFADTELGMKNLIRIVEDYCSYAGNMSINSKKCVSFTYIMNGNTRCMLNDNFYIGNGAVCNISILSHTSYLGLPIAAKASERKKHVSQRIEEMSRDVTKITNSSLKFTQVVDAIKRFIIPKIDYELFSSAAPTVELQRLDRNIRGNLTKFIKGAGLPVDWFYSSKNDGGLNLQMLSERQKALTVRLYVGLRESGDENIRKIVKASDDAEMIYRDGSRDRTSYFLNVKVDNHGYILSKRNHGTLNLLSRCVKALFDLKIGLTEHEDVFTLRDLDPIQDDNSPLTFEVDAKNILKYIMKILKKRHFAHLCSHKMKGHSFMTLKNSSLSSFFLNHSTYLADSVVKFAVKARCNSLMTGSIMSQRTLDPNDAKCKLCGNKETLHHIINGCQKKKFKFTRRHNEVQKVLSTYLRVVKKMIVYEDRSVHSRDNGRIQGDNSTLRPDLYWWDGNILNIAEFTIPYGMMSDNHGQMESTLSSTRKMKINKYKNLIEDCKSQFNCEVNFYVIIVSSLGAVPNETLGDLDKITSSKKDTKMLACRMVATSLRESMFIFMNYDPKNRKDNAQSTLGKDTNQSEDDSDVDSDETTEESLDDADDEDDDVVPIGRSDLLRDLFGSDEVQDSEENEESSVTDSDVLEDPGTTPYWSQDHPPSSSLDDDDDSVQQSSSSTDVM